MSSMPTSTATAAGLQPAPRSIHHLLQCPRASLRAPYPGRPRPPPPRRGFAGPASLLLHPTTITKGRGRMAAAGHRLRQRLAGGVHEAARPHPFWRAAAPVPGVSLCRCGLLGPAGGHHHGLRPRTAHGQSLPDHYGRAGAPAQVGGTRNVGAVASPQRKPFVVSFLALLPLTTRSVTLWCMALLPASGSRPCSTPPTSTGPGPTTRQDSPLTSSAAGR